MSTSKYRCEKCNKFKQFDRSMLKVGDKVEFTKISSNGRSVRMSSVTGKIIFIDGDKVSINYRGTLCRKSLNEVNPLDAPSGLSYAMIGICIC
ncbi:hypothetical protein BZ17_702 [Yersinia pseudotuberculosis IP 32953]|nr:hypothetical protein BZ17_702 [Yersinia pseudotuberculosis IP 32953]PSH43211.1 hypothetical protein BA193_12960 [Yersinia pseudotuberculosis]PSH45787.1 hypothetical protein BA194_17925 [Yersinia pseudotuberculosis]CND86711.1 Uncharacterised protein [Yersinia pseudotuberculosis]CNL86948.1 Uncharacterised protein [Yersinia pseudotuberculosis]